MISSSPSRLSFPLLVLVACAAPGDRLAWPDPVPSADAPAGNPSSADLLALREAHEALLREPADETRIIWYGRRMAYCGDFRTAVAIYGQGLAIHPDSAKLLRHRGHRQITLRRFDLAVLDLARAAARIRDHPDEVEPDGRPNARGIPTSTLHTNIWYHLGLARYLRGEFDEAARCYRQCLTASTNPDMETAARYWLYLSLQRAGHGEAARTVLEPVRADWDIIENHAYHRLCLLYRGDLDLKAFAGDEAGTVNAGTTGYGLACHHFFRGDAERGTEILRQVVAGGPPAAFGCIAAEVDLASDRRT